jgi:glycosyltransferase involved in cell wall biosynthesis
MRTLLMALAAETDELDLLFLVPKDRLLDKDALTNLQSQMCTQWGVRANVTFCPLSNQELPGVGLKPSVTQFFNALHQPKFAIASGEECYSAIENCLKQNPELIFAYCLDSMSPLLSMLRDLPPVVFDLNDIEHVKAFRHTGPRFSRKRLHALLTVPSLICLERRAIKFANKGLVCSECDRRYLSQWLGLNNLEVVPNAVTLPPTRERGEPTLTIGYLGYFPYRPNKKAAEELITRIWPRVQDCLPGAKLLIAGAAPECIPSFTRALMEPHEFRGIEFAGFLANVNQFYDRAQLVCCPIRAGGGTRMKIIEAAAYGLPVVATRLAAEGLDFDESTEIILEDHADKIAKACIALLSDPERCRAIGAAARAKAAVTYQQSSVIGTLRELLRNAARRKENGVVGSS